MQIRVANILYETMTDGPGFRTSIYSQGCNHHCNGCHNPQTWSPDGGKSYDVHKLYDIIVNEELSDVTFSGGDPMFQVEGFTELAKMVKNKTNKTIWCYTGYTYEQIKTIPDEFTTDFKSRLEDAVFAIMPSGFVITHVLITAKPTL